MNALRTTGIIPPRRRKGGKKRVGPYYYDVALKINVQLLEGFRHTIRCEAVWTPEAQDDIDLVGKSSGRVEDMDGDIEMGDATATINIAAHLEPSTA
jgi:hypothetical protein